MIAFGTAGIRGIMGEGEDELNVHTIQLATQGLANYLKKRGEHPLRVVIGYDCRHNSETFAIETARVLAGNGIEAYITQELRPTPFVSFACRALKCSAAVMITASHNPPEYNGYKVYWDDGAQVIFPHDKGIVAEVRKNPEILITEPQDALIRRTDNALDEAFLDAVTRDNSHTNIRIIYSPLHGTGGTIAPKAFARWGFTDVHPVDAQMEPNGDFPTVKSPNPEEEEAATLGIELMQKVQGDLVILNDPDADRIGCVAMHEGKAVHLTGNQIAAICLAALAKRPLPENPACIKSIVTTPLFDAIAKKHNIACIHVLTGFKYIGEKIREWETTHAHTFLFGAEESYGYLYGTHARDKDAMIMGCLIAQIAAEAKEQNKTLIDLLHDLYTEYGVFREGQVSLHLSPDAMDKAMASARATPNVTLLDYNKGVNSLPKSNVLSLTYPDKTNLIIRPSGTEPKIKIYGLVTGTSIAECDTRLHTHLTSLKDALMMCC